MNATPVKTALQFLAAWATVVLFAVLLTLVFSFLGAIFCAALAGMMFGSVRLPLWQAITFSLTFPGVLVSILRTGGAELLAGQIVLLSLVCFAIFWLTNLMVRVVIWYERKPQPKSATCSTNSLGAPQKTVPLACLQEPRLRSATASPSGRFWRELSLQLLQGKWRFVAVNADSESEHKMMVIEQEQLLLTVSDSEGKIRSISKAGVKLSASQPSRMITLSPFFGQACDDTLVSI